MRRPEAERLVKPVGMGTALVRGQLNQTATALPAFFDRPFQHRPANPAAAFALGDPHALELQYANHSAAAFGDYEKLVGVAIDRGEGIAVAGVQSRPGFLALAAKRVSGEQRYDGFQIL